MHTRTNLAIIVVAVVAALLPASLLLADDAPHYVVVIPDPATLTEQSRETALTALGPLLVNAKAGSRISVYDGKGLRRAIDVVIPDEKTPRTMHGIVNAFKAYFGGPTKAQAVGPIDLPRVVREILAAIHKPGENTHAVIIADMYAAAGSNAAGEFTPGEVPGDGMAWAPLAQSSWGTLDLQADSPLSGLEVHWLYVGEKATVQHRRPVGRFLAAWFASSGAELVSLLPEPLILVERVLDEDAKPMFEGVTLDPTQREIRILQLDNKVAPTRVKQIPGLSRAMGRAYDQAQQTLPPLVVRGVAGKPVSLIYLVDATVSWTQNQAEAFAAVESTAAHLPDHTPSTRIAILPYRSQPFTTSLPLTTIRNSSADRGSSRETLAAFLASIQAKPAQADLEAAWDATQRVWSTGEERQIAVLVSDTVADETDPSAADRLLEKTEQWVSSSRDRRLVVVYTGEDAHSEGADYLKSLAAAAGRQGFFCEGTSSMVPTMIRAALTP
jgi:hypothetical protein